MEKIEGLLGIEVNAYSYDECDITTADRGFVMYRDGEIIV
jgi:hypothetical protein